MAKPPFPWIGSKEKIAPYILQLFPPKLTQYVEPFGGSGAVLLALPPDPNRLDIYNDLDAELVNLFSCIKECSNVLLRELRFLPIHGRKLFEYYRDFVAHKEVYFQNVQAEIECLGDRSCFTEEQAGELLPIFQERLALYDVKRAAAYYLAIRGSFSGTINSFGVKGLDVERFLKLFPPVSARLKDVPLENKNALQLIRERDKKGSLTRELRSLGIAVIFEEQNINSIYPESEFLIALHAAFAQSESESISANVRWGKRQSIKDGKVTFQYKTMLGYKKGVDGNPEIIPEEAETVRRIFERYLAGKSIQNIRQALEASGVRNAAGTTEWTASNLRSILTNEKYCGDALLQKSFIKDCISKKAILNTGQLPKVLIQDNHEAIVSREMFDAVQLEIARRRAQDGRTRKSAPTGCGKFSGKYALSGLLFCAECGTAYRRVVWTQHGEKRAVWRCTSRLDYGKRYCLHSPTLDEGPLQQAILSAVNSAMSDHGTLTAQLIDAMEQEFAPIPGESMSLGDIDRAMEGLGQQFNELLRKAADANNADSYTAQFQSISTAMAELKHRKAMILQIRQEQEQTNRRVQAVASVLKTASSELTEWDDI